MDSESDDDDCPLLVESQLSDRFSRKKSIKHATSQKTEKRRPKRNVKNDGDQSSLFYHGRCPEKVKCDSYYSDPVQTHKKYTEANETSRKRGSVRPTYSQVVKDSNNYKPGSTTGYNRKRGDRKTYNSFHRNQVSAPDSNRTSTYRHSHYDKKSSWRESNKFEYKDCTYRPEHQQDVPNKNQLRICCFCGEENHRADHCRFCVLG